MPSQDNTMTEVRAGSRTQICVSTLMLFGLNFDILSFGSTQ